MSDGYDNVLIPGAGNTSPITFLDKLTLQSRLNSIGKTSDSRGTAA